MQEEEVVFTLFNSYLFVLLFLPVCVVGWFALNHFRLRKTASVFLLGMSLFFYGYFNIRYLPIIVSSVLVNYLVYRGMRQTPAEGSGGRGRGPRRLLLAGALLFDLGMLFYFKYYDFFFENINRVFGSDIAMKHLLLPLGISFFTFQQISFVIDAYRGEVPDCGFLDYALFVTFFPQLIAGPIVTHDELIPQFADETRRRLNWDHMASGIYLFALGLAKKVLIADTFGGAADFGFSSIASLDSVSAMVTVLSYTFQIYFDFSGYCDMAMGIGRMLNIDLPLNFDSPYKAFTIEDFWKRWHMTLTRFLRRYVYIPLGGNRRGAFRTYVNIMIVYLVSGLWHGASWTFVLWGAMHGLFVVLTRRFRRFFESLHPALGWMITFAFVNLTWVFFRADTAADAVLLIKNLFALDFKNLFTGINPNLLACFTLPEAEFFFQKLLHWDILGSYGFAYLVVFMLLALNCSVGGRNARQILGSYRPTVLRLGLTVVLMVWCVMSFAGVSAFLYFNF